MRIYVAASSAEHERAKAFAQRLIDAGYGVVGDWWTEVARLRAQGLTDADLSEDEAQRAALANLEAIDMAEAMIWLLGPLSEGAAYEVGYGAATGCHVVCVGPRRSIYTADGCHVDTEDAAIALLAYGL